MELRCSIEYKDLYDLQIKDKMKDLVKIFSDEFYKGNKVAFLYKDSDNTFSFNEDICFYAASTIKILAVLLMFKKIDDLEFKLDDQILIKMSELKAGDGKISSQKEDSYYSLKELLRLTIVESDNTAYLKLVELVGGKQVLKDYGNTIGAFHTMEGKESDCFGITNCTDMYIYIKNVVDYINLGSDNSKLLKEWMLNTTTKKVDRSIINGPFMRKGGEFGIAYHEVGYVEANKPYYLIILTQLGEQDYKNEFINDVAKKIVDLNKYIEVGNAL